MQNQSQYGDVIFLKDLQTASSSQRLTRIHLRKGSEHTQYDEAWLQNLIMLQPGVLPLSQIERSFETFIPVCTELPMQAGFVDNLFVTPKGDIALVECKLWRNPEAKRAVIGQILNYASELSTWDYEMLEAAVRRAKFFAPSGNAAPQDLYDVLPSDGDLDEVAFHDAISRNLRRGRFLLLIVGDGIHEGVEMMAKFLQQHAGLHFTLSIVELALFGLPEGGFIVQPRVLAQTAIVERQVVTFNDPKIRIAPTLATATSLSPTQGATITQEHFFEDLEKGSSGISEKLHDFLNDLASYYVLPDFSTRTMTLRWSLEDSKNWNLGSIVNSGEVWMDYHGQQARNSNMLEASKQYLQDIADNIPGAVVKKTKAGSAWNIADSNGHALRIGVILGDEARMKGWLKAILRFQAAVLAKSQDLELKPLELPEIVQPAPADQTAKPTLRHQEE